MTSSIPEGISTAELQKLLGSAPTEHEHSADCTDADCIHAAVEEALDALTERHPGPLAHKVAMLAICEQMFAWHKGMGEKLASEGEIEASGCWMRDAGHFQVIHNILINISVGSDDFTCNQDN